jgi:hypothetical protein
VVEGMTLDTLSKVKDRFTVPELTEILEVSFDEFIDAFEQKILESIPALAEIDPSFDPQKEEEEDD